MPDIIRLLPDSVANQIAAGEVIQRPASVVKELLENAVDAGASSIKLIVKDAGKGLIQAVDNGCGMSETDARMCFERHATSKIQKADDLFAIRTMGFRGEAMASIAAIAQVEMKTKRKEDELGTLLQTEASRLTRHEACSTTEGTSIAVKNLFYNVPARRKFLKANPVEMRHIIDEFQRVAMAYPEIAFSLYHNEADVFILEKSIFRQRIINIFGKSYHEKLVPVEEETSVIKISGYIGKPEFSKKVRGEQFFFVNNRFIKNAYLHHAVVSAYQGLLSDESYPSYFLRILTDPKTIDINIHPTKTEIKFEDEKSVYAIVRAAVKQSLGKYNIAPSLDFSLDNSFEISIPKKNDPINIPRINVNTDFNPFLNQSQKESAGGKMDWGKMYNHSALQQEEEEHGSSGEIKNSEDRFSVNEKINSVSFFQLHGKYILSQIKSGLMLIHQQRAHERILFEKYLNCFEKNGGATQQLLFPQTIEFSPVDFEIVKDLSEEIKRLGFDLSIFGKNTVAVHGIPAEAADSGCSDLLEKMLEDYKNSSENFKSDKKANLARALAKTTSVKIGKKLENAEMSMLTDELFACEIPYASPVGKPTVITLSMDELDRKFQ